MSDQPGLPPTESLYQAGRSSLSARFQAKRTPGPRRRRPWAVGEPAPHAVDQLIPRIWSETAHRHPRLEQGRPPRRRRLRPRRALPLLRRRPPLLLDPKRCSEAEPQSSLIRLLNQALWDSGLRVSPITRTLAECERFESPITSSSPSPARRTPSSPATHETVTQPAHRAQNPRPQAH